jgi:hypothetical protein
MKSSDIAPTDNARADPDREKPMSRTSELRISLVGA